MNENGTPTPKSLEERGNYFLSNGEYKKAQEYFNRALDMDITCSSCHLGLLLCEYQCKDILELVNDYALSFESSINFKGALRYASAEETRIYKAYLQLAAMACHTKVLFAFAERDFFVMQKRIDAYSEFSCANSKIERVHDYLYMNADNDSSVGPLLTSCLFLYEVYSEIEIDVDSSLEQIAENVRRSAQNTIVECAKIYADVYLENILGADDSYDISSAVQEFCDPKKTDTKGYDFSCNTSEGIDGYGDSPAERYIYLAQKLYEKHRKLSVKKIRNIAMCYKNGKAAAKSEQERLKVLESERDFYLKAASYDKNKGNKDAQSLISTMLELKPDEAELYYDFILCRTKNLTVRPTVFSESENCSNYLSKSFKDFDKGQLDSVFDELEEYKNGLETEYEHYYKELTDYALKATALAKDTSKEKIDAGWSAYEKGFTALYNESLALVNGKIDEVTAKKHDDIRKGESMTAGRSRLTLIASAIFTVLSGVVPAAMAVITFLKPKMLLEYPTLAVYGGALGISVLLAIISRVITGKICKKPAGVFERKKLHRGLFKVAPHLNSVFSVAMLALLVYSFIAFPTQLGTVKIKSAKQLDYMLNCPTANFVLTKDITVKKNQNVSLQIFGGKLDGKGHTITGMTQDEYFVYTNTGTIKNIKFKNYSGKGFCQDNSGEIASLVFNEARFTASVVKKNSKSIKKLTFNSCDFAFANETKMKQAIVYSGATQKQEETFVKNSCTYDNVPMYVNVQEGLNLRQEPWVYSYSYGVMPYNTRVMLQEIGDGWYCVSRNGVTGWCAAEYLSFEQ